MKKRVLPVLGTVLALAACSTHGHQSESTSAKPSWSAPDEGTVTYYDRNSDGTVDLEFHDFGCCDRNWALADTFFEGRYDLEVRWGYSFEKKPVDIAVPTGVLISYDRSGMPTW